MIVTNKNFLARLFSVILIASAGLTVAQAQKAEIDVARLQSPASVPNVQIGGVKNLGIQGDDATVVIQVNWTASAPQGVRLGGFQMSIEIEYADGSKDKSSPTNATPPRTLLRVLNKGANLPRSFKVTVISDFSAPSSTPVSVTEEFDLNKGNNFDSHGNSSPQSRGQFLSITGVKKYTQSCGVGEDCFTITWAVSSTTPGIQSVNKFDVNARMTYHSAQYQGDVERSSGASVDDGTKRQTSIVATTGVTSAAPGDLSIHVKATVKAFVTVATTKTILKEGRF